MTDINKNLIEEHDRLLRREQLVDEIKTIKNAIAEDGADLSLGERLAMLENELIVNDL